MLSKYQDMFKGNNELIKSSFEEEKLYVEDRINDAGNGENLPQVPKENPDLPENLINFMMDH